MPEPIDDPRAAESGAVRRSPDGRIAVRREFAVTSDFMWIVIHGRDPDSPGSTALHDDEVVGWEPIGGCPGTPAGSTGSPQPGLIPIPGGISLVRGEVRFARYEDVWHLVGPDSMLPVGEGIEVERFTSYEDQVVIVGRHVAERTVRHNDGCVARYVLAEIDRGDADV